MFRNQRQRNQRAVRALRNKGIEATPDQVSKKRKAAYASIRQKMRALGHEVPEDDEEMYQLLKFLGAGQHPRQPFNWL